MKRSIRNITLRSGAPLAFVVAGILFSVGSFSPGGLLVFVGLGAILGRRLLVMHDRAGIEDTGEARVSLSGLSRGMLIWIISLLGASYVLVAGVPPRAESYWVVLSTAVVALCIAPTSGNSKWRVAFVAQLVFDSILLRAMGWFAYPPSYVGVDSWYHAALATGINARGVIPANSDYQWFPMMQVAASITSQLLGVDVRLAMFIAVSIPMAVMLPVAAYGTVSRYIRSGPAALFAAFCVAVLPDLVYWGYTPIPMTLSIAFLFLALFVQAATKSLTKRSGLLTAIFVATLLTHTIGAFILASYFLATTLIQPVLKVLGYPQRARSHTAVYGPTLFIILIAYWAEASGFLFPFVIRAVSFGLRLDAFVPPQASTIDPTTVLATVFSTGVVLMFGVAGSILALSRRLQHAQLIPLIGFAWFVIAVTFVGQLGGFSAILPGRWEAFGLGLLALPGGIGFAHLVLSGEKPIRARILTIGLIGLFIVGVAFHPSLSPVPNSPSLYPRLGFLPSETAAAEWITGRVEGQQVYSDSLMTLQLGSLFNSGVSDGSGLLTSNVSWHGYFVFRQSAATQAIYVLTPDRVFWRTYTVSSTWIRNLESSGTSLVYSSGSTVVLWSP